MTTDQEFVKMPCDMRHFDIIFRNIGRRLPLAVTWLNVERQRGDAILRGNMHFGPELYWSNGRLIVGAELPQAVLTALEGHLMTEIVDHPYIPRGLRIASMRQERDSSRWVARPMA